MQKLLFRLVLITIPLLPAASFAQRTMTFDASSSFLFQEFEALIVEKDDQLQVELSLSKASAKNPSIDDKLKKDDLILMMNGTRLTSINDIRAAYENLAEGDEIKIGVRRGQERFILRKEKGENPKHIKNKVMTMDMELDEDTYPVVVSELGLILADKNHQNEITKVIEPLLPEELKTIEVQSFSVQSINGETFKYADEVKMYIEKLSIGDEIELNLANQDDEILISLDKQKPKGIANFSINN